MAVQCSAEYEDITFYTSKTSRNLYITDFEWACDEKYSQNYLVGLLWQTENPNHATLARIQPITHHTGNPEDGRNDKLFINASVEISIAKLQ